jgi:hypothetical protein
LSETQIFSTLRAIQNFENRTKFFNDNEQKNLNKKIHHQMRILDAESNYPIYQKTSPEFNYEVDSMRWQELLVVLSEKLSDTVALKSVEVSN